MLRVFALGLLVGFVVSLLGWQINIISLHRGMRGGRASALVTGLGAATADALLMIAGMSGAKPFLEHFQFWGPMKWVGGSMLIFMALKILFHKPAQNIKDPEVKSRGLTGSFLIGLIVVLANPAVIILWLMASGLILAHFPSTHAWPFLLSFPIAFVAGAMAWFAVLSFVLLGHVKTWSENTLHLLSRCSAVALLGALIFLIFEKV